MIHAGRHMIEVTAGMSGGSRWDPSCSNDLGKRSIGNATPGDSKVTAKAGLRHEDNGVARGIESVSNFQCEVTPTLISRKMASECGPKQLYGQGLRT